MFDIFTFSMDNLLTSRLQTTWGSREGADANDNFRMIELPPYRVFRFPPSFCPLGTAADLYDILYRKAKLDMEFMNTDSFSESDPLLPRYSVEAE
jgi:hypothetical protein